MKIFICDNCDSITECNVQKIPCNDPEELSCDICGRILFKERKCTNLYIPIRTITKNGKIKVYQY